MDGKSDTEVGSLPKNWWPGLHNSLHHADKRKYFSGLSNVKSKGSTHFTWWVKWEKFGHVLAEKKVSL